MKYLLLILLFIFLGQSSPAQQEFIALLKNKWQRLSDKRLIAYQPSFMRIQCSFDKVSEYVGNTAILLNDINLDTIVGGNEVINPFLVMEVYVRQNGKWVMGSMAFSRLIRSIN